MVWTQFSLYKNGFLRSNVERMNKRTRLRKPTTKEKKNSRNLYDFLSTYPNTYL
jgi:hypothetical protein